MILLFSMPSVSLCICICALQMRQDIELLRQQQQQQAVQVPTLPAPKATSPPSAQPVSQPAASIAKAIDEVCSAEFFYCVG